jgi:hypothetical protein
MLEINFVLHSTFVHFVLKVLFNFLQSLESIHGGPYYVKIPNQTTQTPQHRLEYDH